MILPTFAYLLFPVAVLNALLWAEYERFHLPKFFRTVILIPMALIFAVIGGLGSAGGLLSIMIGAFAGRNDSRFCPNEDPWDYGPFTIDSLPDWLLSDWILEHFQNFPYCHGNGIVSWETLFLFLNFGVFNLCLAGGGIVLREQFSEWENNL